MTTVCLSNYFIDEFAIHNFFLLDSSDAKALKRIFSASRQ